jgi:hypothetical protein
MAVNLPSQRETKIKSEFDDKGSRSSIIKIITDEPTLEDALDFNNYSQKLANIVTNSTARFTMEFLVDGEQERPP